MVQIVSWCNSMTFIIYLDLSKFVFVCICFLLAASSHFKILKLDQHKGDRLVHMYLFIGADSQELDKSINHQLAQSELWQKLTAQNKNNGVDIGNTAQDEPANTKCAHMNKSVQSLYRRGFFWV